MLNYLVREKKGRALLVGTFLMIMGFILEGSNELLSKIVFVSSMFVLGFYITIDAVKSTISEKKLNVDLLMLLAAIGAVLIDYYSEGAMLLFIFAASGVLESFVSSKSSNAISELLKHVPDVAKLIKEDGSIVEVKTDELKIDDKISVSKGDQIPIDGYAESEVLVNEASLTGESIPVKKDAGEEVFAGTINEGNSFTLRVSKLKKDTVFSGIIKMVEEAQSKPSRKEQIIDKIESVYVVVVLIAVPLFIFALQWIAKMSFQDAFYRGMVLLTVASPCALVASATPATLSAISNSAKHGVLFRKAKSIESLQKLDLLLTDKTGTLTTGDFEIEEYFADEDILKKVVYIEQNSNHPIAKSIVNKFKDIDLSGIDTNVEIEEMAGSGLKMGDIRIGKASDFIEYGDPNNFLSKKESGRTLSIVAKGNEVVGYFIFTDKIREEAHPAVKSLQNHNVDVEMLTGDGEAVAKYVAEKLEIPKYKANCFPEDKLKYLEEKNKEYNMIAMIGDGINDAPALARADIGIAMGSGSSIAMESSDMVIVKNDINKISHSYNLSKKLQSIVMQNIIFSISVIIILIILNILGKLDLPSGVVFHEGSTILVIMNGLRLLNFKDE
ncbi:heavy metal translocating P-type ATPase [Helcococcus kunzii]